MEIRHDQDRGRFVAAVDGHEATLAYRRVDDTTLDYTSTFVPPELRGQGVGERLVLHALDWARAEGRKVVPTCWFVGKMLDQHPEYADLRAGAA